MTRKRTEREQREQVADKVVAQLSAIIDTMFNHGVNGQDVFERLAASHPWRSYEDMALWVQVMAALNYAVADLVARLLADKNVRDAIDRAAKGGQSPTGN